MSIIIQELDSTDYDHFVDQLNANIDQEAVQKRELAPLHYYAYSALNEEKQSVGGVFGFDNFGALHIEGLWVQHNYRQRKIGRLLIEKAEAFAKERKCKCVTLFTMDFQAFEFYQHLGYIEEFRRHHYHNGSTAIYMIKVL